MDKKGGEGESQHIIIISSIMSRPTHQLIFTLKECHTFGPRSFTTGRRFQRDVGVFLFLGETHRGEGAVSTLLTFAGPVV